jgi:hypothetical protein
MLRDITLDVAVGAKSHALHLTAPENATASLYRGRPEKSCPKGENPAVMSMPAVKKGDRVGCIDSHRNGIRGANRALLCGGRGCGL